MKTILIDDEAPLRKGLKKLLDIYAPQLEVIGEAANFQEALPLINHCEPDLVFLDVCLPDGTGMDLMKALPVRNFEVIFVTAFEQYALEALKLSALDYLLKPIDPDDLVRALEKAQHSFQLSQKQAQWETLVDNLQKQLVQQRKIVLKDLDNLHIVAVNEILACKAEGSYTLFYLQGQREILASKHLKEFEKFLIGLQFIRPHHSYLVNLYHVQKFEKSQGGQLVLSNGQKIPVSVRKKEQVVKAISHL
ncbi:MAG: LytTR family DNA-binding domain-containing protein [Bacteroidota bacterium]